MSRNKKQRSKDPHFEREQAKYEQPIPSREFILQLMLEEGSLVSQEDLAERLGLHTEAELEALRRRLQALVRDGH